MSRNKKYHFIYKTTNILTNRYYYGMHSSDDLDDGYLGSGSRIRRSIRKYGEKNHIREIVEFCETRTELKNREKEIVNLNEISKKDCMNLKIGGEGGFTEAQWKLGAKKMNETLERLKKTDPEWTLEYKKKLSIRSKKIYESGKCEKWLISGQNKWRGSNHTEETKKKIGEKSSINQKGENNSQYGTKWITKNKINKKIKEEELNIFINDDWKLGRYYE